jgi:hypothetical protein
MGDDYVVANDNLYGNFRRDYAADSRRIDGILAGCIVLGVIAFLLTI